MLRLEYETAFHNGDIFGYVTQQKVSVISTVPPH